ncbi:MAG: 3-hydroxyacyl-CoA dehydrogenase family protein [Eubacterium sp.]|nr:3-hydroxyacyl-CoA dehydrogenase family protein [Eubacterium sp.]
MNTIKDKKIAIIGTGMIGTSMAVLLTGHGFHTTLYVLNDDLEKKSKEQYQSYFDEFEKRGLVTKEQIEICKRYLGYTQDYNEIADADIVFECLLEDLELKHSVYKTLEEYIQDPEVIISTTSALSVEDLVKGADKFKDRIIVAHPFFPPHLVPFFEVVGSTQTADGIIKSAVDVLETADREVVVLKKNAPGFIANRLQHALFREAINIVEQGIADARDVDKAAKYSFMPRYTSIGLFEHLDNSGVDLNYNIENYLFKDLSAADKAPKLICDLMEKKEFGVKSGKGIYDWSDVDMDDFKERISAPYWNYFNWDIPTE